MHQAHRTGCPLCKKQLLNNELEIHCVPSSDQTTDLLIEPLAYLSFLFFGDKLGMIEIPSTLRGDVRIDQPSV